MLSYLEIARRALSNATEGVYTNGQANSSSDPKSSFPNLPTGLQTAMQEGTDGRKITVLYGDISDQRIQPGSEAKLQVSDPYTERLRESLRQINLLDYPAGMVAWLDIAKPHLYMELTSRLPDEINSLSDERAPLDQFEAALARLVLLHRRCCKLYRGGSNR